MYFQRAYTKRNITKLSYLSWKKNSKRETKCNITYTCIDHLQAPTSLLEIDTIKELPYILFLTWHFCKIRQKRIRHWIIWVCNKLCMWLWRRQTSLIRAQDDNTSSISFPSKTFLDQVIEKKWIKNNSIFNSNLFFFSLFSNNKKVKEN